MSPTPDSSARPQTTAKVSHRILIVEDEEALAFGVRDALRHAGHEPQVCHNGKTALEMLQRNAFDLVVLDLMLPGMGGLDVLRLLRQHNHKLRVVILTAMSSEADVVRGFEAGADDYVPKPFSPRELLARVEAQFRRVDKEDQPAPQIQLPSGHVVDLARLEVSGGGKIVPLTPREGDILDYLVRNRNRVVTREDLLQDVWHYRNPNIETRTVDIHIVGLRRKIEPDAANPTLIQTVRGKGYRWFS
jgi:DNA-binding response OmpR family regulator